MTSSPRPRSCIRLAAVAVAAGTLVPLLGASAGAAEAEPDTVAPTFTVAETQDRPVDATVTVIFSEPVSGVTSGTLRLRHTPSTTTALADGKTFTVKANALMYAGAPYVVEASSAISDAAGNAYVPLPVAFGTASLVDESSAGMVLLGPWTRLAASGAVGGSYVRSVPVSTRWSATHTAVYGGGAEVKGCVGPGNGIVEVWADGQRMSRVDTYRTATSCGVVLATARFPSGPGLHLVEVRGMGEKSRRSSGTAMAVDAVTVLP